MEVNIASWLYVGRTSCKFQLTLTTSALIALVSLISTQVWGSSNNLPPKIPAPTYTKGFNHFWVQFREAALTQTNKLDELTQLPLEVQGDDDSDPIKNCDAAALQKNWSIILSQEVSNPLPGNKTSISLREFIRINPKFHIGMAEDGGNRKLTIQTFTFEHSSQGWRLVQVYGPVYDIDCPEEKDTNGKAKNRCDESSNHPEIDQC